MSLFQRIDSGPIFETWQDAHAAAREAAETIAPVEARLAMNLPVTIEVSRQPVGSFFTNAGGGKYEFTVMAGAAQEHCESTDDASS